MFLTLVPPRAGAVPSTRATVLDLHSIPSEEAKLIHLLLGTTDFIHTASATRLSQRQNFAVLGLPTAIRGKKGLSSALAAQSIDRQLLNACLSKSITQNSLYGELFDEFSRYFWHTKFDRATQAFLHLYRALERMAYAFPIAYAMKSSDYKGTYTNFRNYVLAKDNTAELAFFRAFLRDLIDAPTLNTKLRLDVSANSAPYIPAHYDTLTKIFSGNSIVNRSPNVYVEIEYKSLLGGFIELRNRYFHFMSGNPNNLSGSNIPEPEEFFSTVNPHMANWLAYIYFRILELRAS